MKSIIRTSSTNRPLFIAAIAAVAVIVALALFLVTRQSGPRTVTLVASLDGLQDMTSTGPVRRTTITFDLDSGKGQFLRADDQTHKPVPVLARTYRSKTDEGICVVFQERVGSLDPGYPVQFSNRIGFGAVAGTVVLTKSRKSLGTLTPYFLEAIHDPFWGMTDDSSTDETPPAAIARMNPDPCHGLGIEFAD